MTAVGTAARIGAGELARMGWRRVDGGPSKITAAYVHAPSRWALRHCGHPTALHPYLLIDAEGRVVLTGADGPARRADFGTAWRCLRDAVEFHQRHLAGDAPFSGPYRSVA